MFLKKRENEYDPIRGLLDLHDEITRFFEGPFWRIPYLRERAFVPAVDIREDKNNVIAEVDLPGVDPKDVSISVENDLLTLRGKKEEKKEEKKEGYLRIERYSGEFYRQIQLPSNVDSTKAKASYKHGVLRITFPKKEEEKGTEIKIDVEG